MHNPATLGDVLFRCAIFSLFSYKCFQLLKAHLVPWLRSAVKQDRNALTELIEKDKLITISRRKLESQIHHQKQLFTVLEHNIKRWHHDLYLAKQQTEDSRARVIAKYNAKLATQQENLFITQALAAALPQALQNAEQQLLLSYARSDGQANFDRFISDLANNQAQAR